ncbi:MAG: acyl-CoA thioesterase [Acidimicrobiales bacterium]
MTTAIPPEAGAGPHPGFVWSTQVFFDDLDAMGMLHNARYFALIERASSAFFEARGWRWERDVADNPDQHFVVRQQAAQYEDPIAGPGIVEVEMWVTRLGRTSAFFEYEVRSPGGRVHARAQRSTVKLDPVSLRPAPWTPRLLGDLSTIVRTAP